MSVGHDAPSARVQSRPLGLGNCEQYRCVGDGVEAMPHRWERKQVTGDGVPLRVLVRYAHSTVQDVHGGFSRVLVIAQRLPLEQRDNGLPQHVFVTAIHGLGAATARLRGGVG